MSGDGPRAFVIGASAGGVEALSVLLPALPRDFPAALLVVLHIPRGRDSLLVDVFTPRCALAVREAQDKEPITPGTVFFAPPDYHLLVDAGPQLALSVDDPVNFSRPSIDVLFQSAAEVYGAQLAGVVLTGGNEDGAAGLEAVKQAGGTAIVQDPRDAKAPYMPQAALRRVEPHYVMGLESMPELFLRIAGGRVSSAAR